MSAELFEATRRRGRNVVPGPDPEWPTAIHLCALVGRSPLPGAEKLVALR